MTTHELLADLRNQGFQLRPLPGDKLEVRPFSKLPEALREELKQRKAEVLALLKAHKHPVPSPDYRDLYRQTAEAITEDCLSLPPAWLLEHPEFYEQISALDDTLTTMERMGACEQEYGATLARLVKCIQDARAVYERQREQASERAVQ
ncbi:MAG TPA: hypothetical protein VGX03_23525 [Candidatus Binatia bacterium]|jgi:hypothetical protein|nr:hypothetical protein [Candidatus Binatia bacterium]